MKEFLAQNWQAVSGAACTLHISVMGGFAAWVRGKADKGDVNSRFSDVHQQLIAVRTGLDQQSASMMELSAQNGRVEFQLGEMHATLTALKESSEKEDEHLKELLRR